MSSGFFSGSATVAEPICNVPCVVDLSPGNYRFRFNHLSDPNKGAEIFATVSTEPSVLRITHGSSGSTRWKGIIGWPLAVASGLLTISAVTTALDTSSNDRQNGVVGFVIFGGLTALGVHLIRGSKTWKQASSSIQYALPK